MSLRNAGNCHSDQNFYIILFALPVKSVKTLNVDESCELFSREVVTLCKGGVFFCQHIAPSTADKLFFKVSVTDFCLCSTQTVRKMLIHGILLKKLPKK